MLLDPSSADAVTATLPMLDIADMNMPFLTIAEEIRKSSKSEADGAPAVVERDEAWSLPESEEVLGISFPRGGRAQGNRPAGNPWAAGPGRSSSRQFLDSRPEKIVQRTISRRRA